MSHKFDMMMEKRVVMKCVDAFLKAGYQIGVNDGEEVVLKRSTDRKAIKEALFSTDEDWLLIYDPKQMVQVTLDDGVTEVTRRIGWVRLIYGNEPPYVINDYTTNLDHVIGDDSEFEKWRESIDEKFYS